MNIKPENRATANGAVAEFSSLTPILKQLVAKDYSETLSLVFFLSEGRNPHFTGKDAQNVENFFNYLVKVNEVYNRHLLTSVHVPSRTILEMAMR